VHFNPIFFAFSGIHPEILQNHLLFLKIFLRYVAENGPLSPPKKVVQALGYRRVIKANISQIQAVHNSTTSWNISENQILKCSPQVLLYSYYLPAAT
jgi:hypothetical protein